MFGQMPRWKLFKVWGHQLSLEPIFLLLIGFFVFSNVTTASDLISNLVWIPVLSIGILWHEIGHALAIDRYGYGKSDIVLQGLGGVTINTRRGHAPPGQSIVISVAGPIFSLSLTVVFGLAAMLYQGNDWFDHFFTMMAFANGVWAVFNMLPIFPLDGGNVMFNLFRKAYRNDLNKAYLHTAYASLGVLGFAIIAGLASGFIGIFWAVLLGFLFGMQNIQIVQQATTRSSHP